MEPRLRCKISNQAKQIRRHIVPGALFLFVKTLAIGNDKRRFPAETGVWSPVSFAKWRGGCLPASPMNSLEGVAGRATRTVLTVTSRRPGAGCISHGDTFLCLAAALSKFLIFGHNLSYLTILYLQYLHKSGKLKLVMDNFLSHLSSPFLASVNLYSCFNTSIL